MEGLFFYVGFTQILALGRQNKMTALRSNISTSCATSRCTATSAST
jgi:ribonucleotide reductase beta subunit family protein with ferritin-like domain